MKKIKTIGIKIVCFIAILFILSLFQPKADNSVILESKEDTKVSLEEFDGGCVVLNYHLVRSSSPIAKLKRAVLGYNYSPEYNIYEDEFAREMKVLHDKGIAVYSLDELSEMMDNNNVPNHCVAITFDDIDQSVYNNAYPILKEYDYPFTIFVVTGKLSRNSGLNQENAQTIKKLNEDDLVITGLHTDHFHDMDETTGVPRFLDSRNNEEFEKDTKLSIKKYEDFLGETPKYFAYPHGFGTAATDKILEENGLGIVFTLRGGAVDNETDDIFMPRVLVTPQSFDETVKWLEETK